MRFVEPQLLWLLSVIPLGIGLGWLAHARRRRLLARFAGGPDHVGRFTGEVGRHRRAAKLLLLGLALGASIVALARPQWGARMEPIQRRGIDVVVLLDTSLSMATEDVAPSRLGQARLGIGSLLERLAGDRVGLITFAGQATLSSPLTVDHAAVRLFLEAFDVETVPVPGTSLASALRLAMQAFGDRPGEDDERSRAIVLFTDGEDHGGGVEELLGELERRGIAVYTVGCGTARGGPIPLRDVAGSLRGYKKDREERVVTSRLDETVLRRLALETGGRYYRTTPAGAEIDEIARALAGMDQSELGTTLRRRYEERFQIPLAVAVIALLAETWLGDRVRRRAQPRRAGARA